MLQGSGDGIMMLLMFNDGGCGLRWSVSGREGDFFIAIYGFGSSQKAEELIGNCYYSLLADVTTWPAEST